MFGYGITKPINIPDIESALYNSATVGNIVCFFVLYVILHVPI